MPFKFPHGATKVFNVLAPFVVEFIGTFFLVTAIGLNALHPANQGSLAPFGIGFTLVVVVFAGGHISGAFPPSLINSP
jgi:glycerol uptake facilitator-like aquaporin